MMKIKMKHNFIKIIVLNYRISLDEHLDIFSHRWLVTTHSDKQAYIYTALTFFMVK